MTGTAVPAPAMSLAESVQLFGLTADAQSVRDAARRREGYADVLVFRLGGERFAVGLAAIEEIVNLPELRALPHMPASMLGVCELRTALLPVYTPGPALGVVGGVARAALVARPSAAGRRVALAIEEAEGVVAFNFEGMTAPSTTDGVVLGVSTRGGRLVAVVDAELLVTACLADRVLEDS
jgi:chemotaxis signal transduction protein